VDLGEARVGEQRAAPVRPPDRGDVAALGVGGQVEDVAVPAGREHHRVGGLRAHPAGDQVAHHDAAGPPVDHHEVEHLVPGVRPDGAGGDLPLQRLVGAEEQLLAGLAARVERAGHLGAAERPGVEQAAVLAGERHALRDGLVDDLDRHLGEAVHIGLPGAEVAALDRVVEEPVHGVAVVAVVLGGVDAALRGDGVRPARAVLVAVALDPVAQLAQRRRRRRTGEAGAHHDDRHPPPVGRADQAYGVAAPGPASLDRPVRCRAVRDRFADGPQVGHAISPVVTANGTAR
jgi:hypothetical protein